MKSYYMEQGALAKRVFLVSALHFCVVCAYVKGSKTKTKKFCFMSAIERPGIVGNVFRELCLCIYFNLIVFSFLPLGCLVFPEGLFH